MQGAFLRQDAVSFLLCPQVQGVWFRKFTVAKAQALHLVGWCANSQRGTVMGECQGKPEDLEVMKVGETSSGLASIPGLSSADTSQRCHKSAAQPRAGLQCLFDLQSMSAH